MTCISLSTRTAAMAVTGTASVQYSICFIVSPSRYSPRIKRRARRSVPCRLKRVRSLMVNHPEKVEFDRQYMRRRSLWFDLKIIALTALKVIRRDGIRQADQPSDASLFTVMQRGTSVLILTLDTSLSTTAEALEHFASIRASGATLINVRDLAGLPDVLAQHSRTHRLCLVVVRKHLVTNELRARCESNPLPTKVVELEELGPGDFAVSPRRLKDESQIVGDWLQHLGESEKPANASPNASYGSSEGAP